MKTQAVRAEEYKLKDSGGPNFFIPPHPFELGGVYSSIIKTRSRNIILA